MMMESEREVNEGVNAEIEIEFQRRTARREKFETMESSVDEKRKYRIHTFTHIHATLRCLVEDQSLPGTFHPH